MRLFDISHTIDLKCNQAKILFQKLVLVIKLSSVNENWTVQLYLCLLECNFIISLLGFTIKTHLSAVVNCRIVNNRHVDYRFYATTSGFFHRSLDLLHYTWY